jgi:tubulin polyglutamylase TTLL4
MQVRGNPLSSSGFKRLADYSIYRKSPNASIPPALERGTSSFLHFSAPVNIKPIGIPHYSPAVTAKLRSSSASSAPLYYHGSVNEYHAVVDVLEASGMQRTKNLAEAQLVWALASTEVGRHASAPNQKMHHFPGSAMLGNKVLLAGSVSRMISKFGRNVYGIIPRTFIVPDSIENLIKVIDNCDNLVKWIYKPADRACGRGIQIWSNAQAKEKLLEMQRLQDQNVPQKAGVVSRYVDNPLLINDQKFDLRLYVLVTSFDPLRIYLWRDGLVRFATNK